MIWLARVPASVLVVCLASAITCIQQSDSLGALPSRGIAAGSSRRNAIALNRPQEIRDEILQNSAKTSAKNYITAIEDATGAGGERGLMVATSDQNYAIYSPTLRARAWTTLTLNGDQVFIVTAGNVTIRRALFDLSEQERDLIAEARANFTQYLAGLKFSHSYTLDDWAGGSSRTSSTNQINGPNLLTSSLALRQIGKMESTKVRLYAPPAPPPDRTTSTGSSRYQIEAPVSEAPPPSAQPPKARHSRVSVDWEAARARSWPPQAHGSAPSVDVERKWASGQTVYDLAQHRNLQQAGERADWKASEARRRSLCSPNESRESNFNYYNLQRTALNETLAGDVYHFDFHCNILDVYSRSVFVRRQADLSALYRHSNFFSYARSHLPLSINRFFVSDDQVFFVYDDGSVLVKMSWMLEASERELVLEARQTLKLADDWQNKAADLLIKSVPGRSGER